MQCNKAIIYTNRPTSLYHKNLIYLPENAHLWFHLEHLDGASWGCQKFLEAFFVYGPAEWPWSSRAL